MHRLRAVSCVLGLSAAVVLCLGVLGPRQGVGHEDDAELKPGAAIELPARPIELMIELGIEGEQQVPEAAPHDDRKCNGHGRTRCFDVSETQSNSIP